MSLAACRTLQLICRESAKRFANPDRLARAKPAAAISGPKRQQQLGEAGRSLELWVAAAAVDQLDLRGRQRVERHAGVRVRKLTVVRAPHEQHGAADADEVEGRVRELRGELAPGLEQRRDVRAGLAVAAEGVDDRLLRLRRVRERELAVRARLAAADELAGHGDRQREQPAHERVLLDRI